MGSSAIVLSALTLVLPPDGGRSVTTVDPKGACREEVRFAVPVSDIQQVWMPSCSQPLLQRKWSLKVESAPQCDMPYLAFFNLANVNRLSFGAQTLEWDSEIAVKLDQEHGVYRVTFAVATDGKPLAPFKLTVDRRKVAWTQTLAEWRNALGGAKGSYPESAWRPVYCTWYAAHAALSQDWVEAQARLAADLGFGTFILDDGWSYDEAKRVNPTTIVDWYRDTGKWDAFSSVKFPDFKAHRARMRDLGLKYMVWVAPYFVGSRSPVYAKYADRFNGQNPFEGNVLADPGDGVIMDVVSDQLVSLLKEADLDGLKIDFLDYIKPSVEKPRGGASLDFVRKLVTRLRAVKPECLLEFRQSYANPVTASLATQFRAGDVPFEWLDNLMRIAQIRLLMGDGVPVHADPICWSNTETEDNIRRHFLAAMAGVPMLSMDLRKLTPAQKALVRRALDFYRTRVERFQHAGKWTPVYRNGGLACLVAETKDEFLAIVNDDGCVPQVAARAAGRRRTILNLSFATFAFPNGLTVGPASAGGDGFDSIENNKPEGEHP